MEPPILDSDTEVDLLFGSAQGSGSEIPKIRGLIEAKQDLNNYDESYLCLYLYLYTHIYIYIYTSVYIYATPPQLSTIFVP